MVTNDEVESGVREKEKEKKFSSPLRSTFKEARI